MNQIGFVSVDQTAEKNAGEFRIVKIPTSATSF